MKVLSVTSIFILSGVLFYSCSVSRNTIDNSIITYTPNDRELYNSIFRLDSIFWESYNSCNMSLQSEFYSDNIEFYHDGGGLITSKQLILDATESSVCGQIRREPVKGTIEIYPINGFGAIEMGMHTFHRSSDMENISSRPGKYIIIWKQEGSEWTISRVISIH